MNLPHDLPFFLKLKDYSVTKEDFSLHLDEDLEMLVTVPQPNPTELHRYYESDDYISHTDGSRGWFESAYQFVKQFALAQKLRTIEKLQPGGTLLDIGAGTGAFVQKASARGWKATGFEPDEKARKLALSKGISLLGSMDALPDAGFDVITMWHVLEHVPDLPAQIQLLKRLLKPGGLIVIAVPNYRSADALHYGNFWAAYDVPRHLWHFSRTSVSKLMQRNGLSLVGTKPMWFDAFYVSLLSEKYKTGGMRPVPAFWQGLRSNFKAMRTGEYSSLIYLVRHRAN